MTSEFTSYDPLSRHPEEERPRIRELYLRSGQIALDIEDHNIDLEVLSERTGIRAIAIKMISRGHVHDVSESVIRAIEDAVADIVGEASRKDLFDDLANYGQPDARILEIIKIFTEMNDDIYHARHVSIVHGHTARIRAILDRIDASPELEIGTLHGDAA